MSTQQSGCGAGWAKFKCNKCGLIVQRNLGFKLWTPSHCKNTNTMARLYRISTPTKNKRSQP